MWLSKTQGAPLRLGTPQRALDFIKETQFPVGDVQGLGFRVRLGHAVYS
jgi:hypothetical protein